MKKYIDILNRCPLFQNIEAAALTGLLDCLDARVFQVCKNQTILSEGGPAKYVGIVLSGRVSVVRDDFFGNRSMIAMLEPPQLFGEVFACAGVEAMPVSVNAVCDSEIMLVDCRRILTVCANTCEFHTLLVNNLLRNLADKNLLLNQKIDFTSKRTTREKLMAYLLAQAKKNHSSQFTIPYDRQTLADYLEVDRSAMSAEIGKLRREGVIECKRSWFHLL